MASKLGSIRIGVGGWTFEPWRGGEFYPEGLAQKRELEFASRQLASIEINGTYYGSQKPASFAKWHAETPDGFIFAVKGPRFATYRRVLAESGESITRFFGSGVLELKEKLGPINWQFMATKKFDAVDFEGFLKLLPKRVDGVTIRHAVEVRHASFACAAFVELARAYGVAVVIAGDSEFPMIPDVTADFVYARLLGTSESEADGYAARDVARWVNAAQGWATGKTPDGQTLLTKAPKPQRRDVFLYVISGFKARNPKAATAMLARLRDEPA